MICVFSTHTCDPILSAQGEKHSDIYRGQNVTSYCQDYVKAKEYRQEDCLVYRETIVLNKT